MSKNSHSILVAMLMGGVVACTTAYAQETRTPSTSASATVDAGRQQGMLNQSQALGVLSVINRAEINAGQMASAKGQGAETKRYGQAMVKAHTENDAKLKQWRPAPSSPQAQQMDAHAKTEAAKLSSLQGAAFDTAYINAMVMDHRKALDTLDTMIVPAAKDAAVVAFLKETRMHVADHLKQAQALQGAMGKTPDPGAKTH